jgi:hypothetical protein
MKGGSDTQFQFNERSLVLKRANASALLRRIPTIPTASAFLNACVKAESPATCTCFFLFLLFFLF